MFWLSSSTVAPAPQWHTRVENCGSSVTIYIRTGTDFTSCWLIQAVVVNAAPLFFWIKNIKNAAFRTKTFLITFLCFLYSSEKTTKYAENTLFLEVCTGGLDGRESLLGKAYHHWDFSEILAVLWTKFSVCLMKTNFLLAVYTQNPNCEKIKQ